MRSFNHLRAIAIVIAVAGCGAPHGQPRTDSEVLAPNQITDFATLYSDNCSACHGAEGKGGAAIALANLVFLATADDASIRKVSAQGIPGTAMPAFAQSAGGMLTDEDANLLEQTIADVTRVRVSGLGHQIHTAAPDAALRIVLGFLESLDN